MGFQYTPLNPNLALHHAYIAQLWNAACGSDLAISPDFAGYNLQECPGSDVAGRIAWDGDRPVAVAVARRELKGTGAWHIGWLDALAVDPAYQRQGIGRTLVGWAETWFMEEGCSGAFVGGGLRPFTAGVPAEIGSDDFFIKARFILDDDPSWDMARDLGDYVTPPNLRLLSNPRVSPLQPGEEGALLEFLEREFPGRWLYEVKEIFRTGDRRSDIVTLWTEDGVDGFCIIDSEGSNRPLNRFFPARLPQPWGQLGAVGVSERCRGLGYGARVVDAGLSLLRDRGVRGCVIDWLTIVDFYAKFGFECFRQYHMFKKSLV